MMSRVSGQYAIELDGIYYRCSGEEIEEVADLRDIQGDLWMVSDLQGALSRTMTVEAPFKYVDVMVRKTLQETGEFDEPVAVITHWKKKRGASAADIFFTALPTRLYYQYLDQGKTYQDNLLLFPLYSVLFTVLKRMRHSAPVGVVFRHGRFADLIIGTGKRVFYADRCVAFDQSAEQISSLWNMVRADIENTEKENRIKVEKILLINWIDAVEKPEWPDEMETRLFSMEEEGFQFKGKTRSTSFLKAVRMCHAVASVSGVSEKAAYWSRKSLPLINGIVLLVTLLFFAGYFYYDHRAELVGKKLNVAESKVASLAQGLTLKEIPYEKTLAFVRELGRYGKTPSFKQVLGDISDSLGESISVDMLRVDYGQDSVEVKAIVKVKAPFEEAYRGYQAFVSSMRQKGYVLEQGDFNTTIAESQFLVRLEKKI